MFATAHCLLIAIALFIVLIPAIVCRPSFAFAFVVILVTTLLRNDVVVVECLAAITVCNISALHDTTDRVCFGCGRSRAEMQHARNIERAARPSLPGKLASHKQTVIHLCRGTINALVREAGGRCSRSMPGL
jgi:predicted Fe-S protein YdhL (DUF1289 family)